MTAPAQDWAEKKAEALLIELGLININRPPHKHDVLIATKHLSDAARTGREEGLEEAAKYLEGTRRENMAAEWLANQIRALKAKP